MFFVAGFQYHHGPTVVHKMREGDPLDMIPEPHNPHDPLAVRLEWNGIMIGYVPRAENQVVNALLQQDAPLEAFIYEVDPDADPWQAVMAEVLLVT
ncbi:MAG: HIRAN domain-containing protein [Deltaproteobacteria bacterium]|nr:HIRAN domain-containing protein [Deltaproteobacteria bacterium]